MLDYKVSVRFNDHVEQLWSGTVKASNFATAAQRAVREAKKAYPRLRCGSVMLDIEKLGVSQYEQPKA